MNNYIVVVLRHSNIHQFPIIRYRNLTHEQATRIACDISQAGDAVLSRVYVVNSGYLDDIKIKSSNFLFTDKKFNPYSA